MLRVILSVSADLGSEGKAATENAVGRMSLLYSSVYAGGWCQAELMFMSGFYYFLRAPILTNWSFWVLKSAGLNVLASMLVQVFLSIASTFPLNYVWFERSMKGMKIMNIF